jgi:cyclophilin family peptidyl-prolyl cis-trans isomerase
MGDICLHALDKLGDNFCVHCAFGDIVEGMSLLDRYSYNKDIEEDRIH